MISIPELRKLFKGTIRINEPLEDYTALGIGGPADFYIEPASCDDAIAVIGYLRKNNIPFIIIRRGSNILVSEAGYRGAVINLQPGVARMEADGDEVHAEAGTSVSRLLDFCIGHSLSGLESLSGLQATLGGVLARNGSSERDAMLDSLKTTEILRGAAVISLTSGSPSNGDIVLGARFRLTRKPKADLLRAQRDYLLKRNAVSPLNIPRASRIFKNPAQAATMIHDSGLEGRVRGQAMISKLNGNLIVNNGGATAKDILDLVRLSRQTVKRKFNTDLDLDLNLVGFGDDVLNGVSA
jgi:UDP-N-acetylmuramate dehydrogenase